MWPRGDLVSLRVRRDSLAGAERTGIGVGARRDPSGKGCTSLRGRLGTHFGARVRAESLRTILAFEGALGLREKLIRENGNVIRPFQEGEREADHGPLQALGPERNNLPVFAGNEGLGRSCERKGV